MFDILARAACFVAIILLGFVLRKVGVFQGSDFKVLSKLVVKITLPAAIVSSFSGKEFNPALLSLALVGLVVDLIHMGTAWLLHRRKGNEQLAFAMINLPGYSIGTFTLPFVQSFLGASGVIAVSLFDVGNACICLGTTHSVGKAIMEGSRFSLKQLVRNLFKSAPFVCYLIVVLLKLTRITLPGPVISFAEIIGNANAFTAMFMIGVGLKLEFDRSQFGRIIKLLAIRLGLAAVLALICWFCLPFDQTVRQVLVLLLFSPIGSTAPAYTGDIHGDVGLASAVNSLSIIVGLVAMVTIMVTLF